ncbi:GumC family protein [Planctomycetota bacterium]
MSEDVVETKECMPQCSLRDLYNIVFRHKWKIIAFFLVSIITVGMGTLYSAEFYRSEAKLLIRLGRESVALDPTATTGRIVSFAESREREIMTELAIIESREIVEKTVDAIGVEVMLNKEHSATGKTHRTVSRIMQRFHAIIKRLGNLTARSEIAATSSNRESVIGTVRKNLYFQTQKNSSMITLTYESQNPKLAQDVLTKFIDSYLEKHITVHQTPGSHQFFIQQSGYLQGTIIQLENELQNLKNETGISSIEEQLRVVLERISVLEKEIDIAETTLISSKTKVQTLQKILATIPETVVTGKTTGYPNIVADEMRTRLYELHLMEQELSSKYSVDTPKVQNIRRQIATAQALLSNEKTERTQLTEALNVIHQEIRSELLSEQANLSSLQSKVEELKRILPIAQEELKAINDAEVKINTLIREIHIQEANYRKYTENLEQARIDNELDKDRISNISIVQAATLPTVPIRPRKMLNILLGLLLGIFGGIGLAFLSEYLDHSIRTPEDVQEKLQLPTLASIPYMRANRIHPTGKQRKAKSNDKDVKSPLTQWKIPAKLKDHYKAFREELLLNSDGHSKAPYVFAIISCSRGEGVSTVAANISASLAMLGTGRVLIVDANVFHPSVHRIFKTRLGPGLVNILAPNEDYQNMIVSWCFQKLHILTAGISNGISSGIFHPSQFIQIVNSMKQKYSYVVIDMPALKEASSAIRLAGLCDGVVLVVEADHLRWEIVQKAKEQFPKWNAKILGVVLNKRRFHIPKWLYRTL